MQSEQRMFLEAVMAAAQIGTLHSNVALTQAPSEDLRPIAETIQLYQEMVAFHGEHGRPAWEQGFPEQGYLDGIEQRFDHILGVMNHHFGGNPGTTADIEAWWYHRQPDMLTVEDLRVVVQGTIPVLVMRNLLGRHRMYVRLSGLLNWHRFVQIYSDNIIAVDWTPPWRRQRAA